MKGDTMRYLYLLLVLSILLIGCASQPAVEEAEAVPAEPVNPFVGAWEFVHVGTPDGPNTSQRGHMVVSDEHVCFVRVGNEREAVGEDDSEEVAAQKAAELFNAVRATCGTYEVEGNTLKATWLTSAEPTVEGNVAEFIMSLEDDTVSLAPAAAPEFQFVYRRIN
jgi:hypothetical protein